jgi:hypothetical protein
MSLYLTLFWKEGEGERGIGKKERDRKRERRELSESLAKALSVFRQKKWSKERKKSQFLRNIL